MTGIYLLLGSNLGDRTQHISRAKTQISQRIGPIILQSKLYNTASWGNNAAGDFLNQAIEVKTKLNPFALLYQCLTIEIAMGRHFEEHMHSRTIDIDILYYHQQIIQSDILTIPHPQIPYRRFALQPMCDLNPLGVHPQNRHTQQQLLQNCDDPLTVEQV